MYIVYMYTIRFIWAPAGHCNIGSCKFPLIIVSISCLQLLMNMYSLNRTPNMSHLMLTSVPLTVSLPGLQCHWSVHPIGAVLYLSRAAPDDGGLLARLTHRQARRQRSRLSRFRLGLLQPEKLQVRVSFSFVPHKYTCNLEFRDQVYVIYCRTFLSWRKTRSFPVLHDCFSITQGFDLPNSPKSIINWLWIDFENCLQNNITVKLTLEAPTFCHT